MRARVKLLADMPAEVLCCAAAITAVLKHEGLIVELVGKPSLESCFCSNCGVEHELMHYRVLGQTFHWVQVSTVDIEEGSDT